MEMVRELSPEKASAALHCPEYPSPSPGIQRKRAPRVCSRKVGTAQPHRVGRVRRANYASSENSFAKLVYSGAEELLLADSKCTSHPVNLF